MEQEQRFFTFRDLAAITGTHIKTIRNRVSAGLLPRPQKTVLGPRFSKAQIDLITSPPPPKRGRGRPRIARPPGKKGKGAEK